MDIYIYIFMHICIYNTMYIYTYVDCLLSMAIAITVARYSENQLRRELHTYRGVAHRAGLQRTPAEQLGIGSSSCYIEGGE